MESEKQMISSWYEPGGRMPNPEVAGAEELVQ